MVCNQFVVCTEVYRQARTKLVRVTVVMAVGTEKWAISHGTDSTRVFSSLEWLYAGNNNA